MLVFAYTCVLVRKKQITLISRVKKLVFALATHIDVRGACIAMLQKSNQLY
jgi:hypothetical protein